jgi:hypothetical protein
MGMLLMKLDEETRFPHPVLSADTADYAEGEFGVTLKVSEQVNLGDVTFDYEVSLTQPDLRSLVTAHSADLGIFVNCHQTYYSGLIPLGLDPGRFSFDRGRLAGRVTVRPIVWTSKPVNGFPLANAHAEFGGGTTDFAGGTILALGEESSIFVGHEKLAQMDSIFTISKAEQLAPSTLSVFLGEQKIKILVAPDIYEPLNRLRDISAGKPTVLNGVYLPAIMQILDILRDGGAGFEGLRWYRVFDAKCAHYNINTQDPDIWSDAQKLLQAPFSEIQRNAGIYGS